MAVGRTEQNMFLKNFFSIKTVDIPGELSRKEVCILGFKLRFLNTKYEFIKNNMIINQNTLHIAHYELQSAKEDELFLLGNNSIRCIFNNKVNFLGSDFLKEYVLSFGRLDKLLQFTTLDKNSELYQEHIERTKNGEFFWKYTDRFYNIEQSYLKIGENNKVYICTINEDETEKSREYIQGCTVGKYIKNKPYSVQVEIVTKMFNYIFDNFASSHNKEKISALLSDCHLYNIVIDSDNNFHYIDFDDRFNKELDKEYCIYYALYRYNRQLYLDILNKFGFKDKHKIYIKDFSMSKVRKKNEKKVQSEKYIALKNKYFSNTY